jgi:hypothetical protein
MESSFCSLLHAGNRITEHEFACVLSIRYLGHSKLNA